MRFVVVTGMSGGGKTAALKMLEDAGYYTIDLPEEVLVEAGNDFAIVVKIITEGAEFPVAIECPVEDLSENADMSDGRSYLSLQGTLWEHIEETKNYSEFIDKNQKVAIAYDIKLLKDGATVQPDGTLRFKIVIPEELRGKDFSIIHIHNGNETSVIEYQIDGDYIVFESDKLSDFVFVYEMDSILWVVIILGVLALFEIAFLIYVSKKNKQLKSKKLMSAYPPFLFGMFIAEWEIVLAIVLAVVVIVLAVVSIIFATKVINSKTKTSTKDEEIALAKATNENPSTEAVEDAVDEKDSRIVKSFLERLGNCSSETLEYYNDIKNELLSYKKVKSKILNCLHR